MALHQCLCLGPGWVDGSSMVVVFVPSVGGWAISALVFALLTFTVGAGSNPGNLYQYCPSCPLLVLYTLPCLYKFHEYTMVHRE